MNDDILRDIYAGEVHMEECMMPTSQEYKERLASVRRMERAFREALPEELGREFTRLTEARSQLTGMEVEHACLTGMRSGAQMLLALLKKEERGNEIEP